MATWEAYSEAYERRYRVAPIRNATVNGVLAQLVARLGPEAPDVAAHFLRVEGRNGFYATAKHPVQLLLRDAEALRTAWATNERSAPAAAPVTHRQQRAAEFYKPAEPREADGQTLDVEARDVTALAGD